MFAVEPPQTKGDADRDRDGSPGCRGRDEWPDGRRLCDQVASRYEIKGGVDGSSKTEFDGPSQGPEEQIDSKVQQPSDENRFATLFQIKADALKQADFGHGCAVPLSLWRGVVRIFTPGRTTPIEPAYEQVSREKIKDDPDQGSDHGFPVRRAKSWAGQAMLRKVCVVGNLLHQRGEEDDDRLRGEQGNEDCPNIVGQQDGAKSSHRKDEFWHIRGRLRKK